MNEHEAAIRAKWKLKRNRSPMGDLIAVATAILIGIVLSFL